MSHLRTETLHLALRPAVTLAIGLLCGVVPCGEAPRKSPAATTAD